MEYGRRGAPLAPEEVSMIERVFRHELQSRALPRECEAAEVLAARLIGAYQSGMHDLAELAQAAERM